MVDRYEIDEEHKIVDFYIEDQAGREQHSAKSFDEALRFAERLISEIRSIDRGSS